MRHYTAAVSREKDPYKVAVLTLLALGSMIWIFTFFPANAAAESAMPGKAAVAVLHPTQGNDVSGVVRFTPAGDAVKIEADVQGLKAGKHGFHIHQYGDCTAPDGTSAGGHYNPDDYPHAGPDQKKRHMGDMGNLEADTSGRSHYERKDDYITLNGEKSIVGHAVIVHAGEDDLTSQPTGNAGARLACGVIGYAGE